MKYAGHLKLKCMGTNNCAGTSAFFPPFLISFGECYLPWSAEYIDTFLMYTAINIIPLHYIWR